MIIREIGKYKLGVGHKECYDAGPATRKAVILRRRMNEKIVG